MNYCGTFEVVGDEVIHHVENSLFPEWIGTDRARTYQFHDEDRELRLVGDAGGLVQELVWRRLT
jgi:hypothetical protein